MRKDVPELLFISRDEFRVWLNKNAEKSDGVFLVFSKTKEMVTLSANDALEEALCFGWIDGQMKSIDNTKYIKYFSKRRPKSNWSEKNKITVGILQKKGLMTGLGEKAVETAKINGIWDLPKSESIADEQIKTFTDKLKEISPAYENYNNMSQSVKTIYIRRFLSFKTDEARERDFLKIVERLNRNLKPM